MSVYIFKKTGLINTVAMTTYIYICVHIYNLFIEYTDIINNITNSEKKFCLMELLFNFYLS